jgi:hypothetical protein
MKKQILNEEFRRMQKLAGLITESEYKSLTENKASDLINEAFNPFLDTEEGGYMREYIDDVVEDSMDRPDSLDLEYRSDFDIAFDLALTRLQNDHPELDFDAIEANKEAFLYKKTK